MSEATHLAQMFDSTVVRVHVSAAETKGSRMQRISKLTVDARRRGRLGARQSERGDFAHADAHDEAIR